MLGRFALKGDLGAEVLDRSQRLAEHADWIHTSVPYPWATIYLPRWSGIAGACSRTARSKTSGERDQAEGLPLEMARRPNEKIPRS